MDAISFVLGVRSVDLRARNLGELIYQSEGLTLNEAYVELAFVTSEGHEMTFKRDINASGTSHYFINRNQFDSEAYVETLESFGIFTKTKNFLVFQG
jgi:structural maintenance of chromosome 1